MPHKHTVKVYVANGHYHAYNRGVEKREIYKDEQDYRVFLHLLKYYLAPEVETDRHPLASIPGIALKRPRPLANLGKKVELLVYCLMPNHFHLLLKQKTETGMTELMRRLSTTYAMYFNRRYDRVGYLFQGNYKAALIETDAHLLHLSRYIHLNPLELTGSNLVNYRYSSYPYYLGEKRATWIKPDFILSYFDNSPNLPSLNQKRFLSYQEYVERNQEDPREPITSLTID